MCEIVLLFVNCSAIQAEIIGCDLSIRFLFKKKFVDRLLSDEGLLRPDLFWTVTYLARPGTKGNRTCDL